MGTNKEKATLEANTQQGTRYAILTLICRYQADRAYISKRLNERFATDTIFQDIKSLNHNICAQENSHKVGLSSTYPMRAGSGDKIEKTYKDFCHEYGVPEHLTFDAATAQIGNTTMFMKTISMYGTRYHVSSPRRPNQNPTEGAIRGKKKYGIGLC